MGSLSKQANKKNHNLLHHSKLQKLCAVTHGKKHQQHLIITRKILNHYKKILHYYINFTRQMCYKSDVTDHVFTIHPISHILLHTRLKPQ